jgi:hypothetical protein
MLFKPKFMPEGVSPASGVLMTVMREIFVDFEEFMIVIFDNMLILACNFNDAFDKLKKVIKVCREKNVALKMAKSWLGFRDVKCFGYEIS